MKVSETSLIVEIQTNAAPLSKPIHKFSVL